MDVETPAGKGTPSRSENMGRVQMDRQYRGQTSAQTLAALLNNLRRFKGHWDCRRRRLAMMKWRSSAMWAAVGENRCESLQRTLSHVARQSKRLGFDRWKVVAATLANELPRVSWFARINSRVLALLACVRNHDDVHGMFGDLEVDTFVFENLLHRH